MYKFIWENSFKKAYKKITKNNDSLKSKITEVLSLLQIDPYLPKLRTHKLHGKLSELYAASIDYEYRIVFKIEEIENFQYLILVDIGTHDEVY